MLCAQSWLELDRHFLPEHEYVSENLALYPLCKGAYQMTNQAILNKLGYLLATIFLLSGCNFPSAPVTEVRYPYCLVAADLIRPVAESPTILRGSPESRGSRLIAFPMIDDLSPTLSWSYPHECRPLNYQFQLAASHHYNDCFSQEWESDSSVILSETIGSDTEWSPSADLDPMTLYHWQVAGIIHDVIGEYSWTECFFTGPVCEADSLVAPELVSPEDVAIIDVDHVVLVWSHPEDCLPHIYQPELSDDPTFSGPNMMETISDDEIKPFVRQLARDLLLDCTQYYWRVSAHVDSTWGPTSVVRTFTTDFEGTCSEPDAPTDTPMPAALLPTETTTIHIIIGPTATRTPKPTQDETPPPAPSPKSPSGGEVLGCASQIVVSWDPVSDPSGISEYRVQLGTHSGDFNWNPPAGSPYTGITTTETSVSVDCGWYYRWRVRAIDGAGNMGPLSEWAEFTITLE